ncbi:hypothetical protein M513_10182, partial [Trichuris suis]
ALRTIEQWLQWFEDNDCNAESSRTATRGIRSILEPYCCAKEHVQNERTSNSILPIRRNNV